MLMKLLSGALFLSSSLAFASPCSDGTVDAALKDKCELADALYEKRGELYLNKDLSFDERAANANHAIDAYKEILPQTSGAARAYIGSKIARSYLYIGDYLMPKSDRAPRREYFAACQKFIETEMNADKVGSENLQPYYYLLSSCWAFKLEMSNVFIQLREKGALEANIYTGLRYANGNDYLGGAIRRSLAGIRSSRAAIAIGAGNVEESLAEASAALETPENTLFNNHPLSGSDYCENYRYKAEAFVADPNSAIYSLDDATETLEEAFSYFGVEGDYDSYEIKGLPAGFEVDTIVCVERLMNFVRDNGIEPDM